MRRMRTNPAFFIATAALLSLIAAATAATAQEAIPVPVAPAEGAELTYDIPLRPWLVPPVLELKSRFADGLSVEFGEIAETQTGEDLEILVAAGTELAEATAEMRASIDAIGELDVTFGIEGISRIIPAESALRDTLFGFVVWHEFSSTPARGMMTRFENLVGHVASGGEASGEFAAQLAEARRQLEQAVEQGDSRRIAELTPSLIETSRRIDAVCVRVAGDAYDLSALVDSLSADSSELLSERWVAASEAVDAVRAPAERTGPALESMSDVLDLLIGLGELLGPSVASVDALSAAPAADGNLYIPWTVLRADWKTSRDLMERIVAGPPDDGVEEAGGENAEHAGHAHAEHAYLGGAVSPERRARMGALIAHQVRANSILAERAVEYTSTVVAGATDAIERMYKDRAGYSDDLSERRKQSVLEDVDRNMRENMELFAANFSASSARASLERGRAFEVSGSEIDALYYYQNAWLHCLNAGASAKRVSGGVSSR